MTTEQELEKSIERLQIGWNNVNIDYWILRKAIEDVLPKLEGYEKGRLSQAIKQVDTERQRMHRKLQTLQPLERVAV